MTAAELKAARRALGIQQNQLAALLDTPLKTLQDWEYGRTRIPGHMAVTMGLLIERDEKLTKKIVEDLKATFNRGVQRWIGTNTGKI